jgi:NADH dehydrogenase [ubiquinone] 1 alpha subcomplex assembly factor 7
MGIGTRVSALQRAAASPARADALSEAAARLVDPAGMGREYKVMGVTGGMARTADADGMWPFVAGEIREEKEAAAERAPHHARDSRPKEDGELRGKR